MCYRILGQYYFNFNMFYKSFWILQIDIKLMNIHQLGYFLQYLKMHKQCNNLLNTFIKYYDFKYRYNNINNHTDTYFSIWLCLFFNYYYLNDTILIWFFYFNLSYVCAIIVYINQYFIQLT